MERRTFHFHREVSEWIDKMAARHDTSRACIVRQALEVARRSKVDFSSMRDPKTTPLATEHGTRSTGGDPDLFSDRSDGVAFDLRRLESLADRPNSESAPPSPTESGGGRAEGDGKREDVRDPDTDKNGEEVVEKRRLFDRTLTALGL